MIWEVRDVNPLLDKKQKRMLEILAKTLPPEGGN
jgi:hypothetical protein